MNWSKTSNIIKSIEFYKMHVEDVLGKSTLYQGAILFGQSRDTGCEVLKVLIPTPDTESLLQNISETLNSKLRERLIFLNHSKDDVVDLVQSFCQQGLPLPNVFDESISRLEGLSVFQLACYKHACVIPHGETKSYAWLAERLKKYGAERAVGGAMKANPFPLLIPCHRVVKKDGNIGGFMGTASVESWQIKLKKTLLQIESLHQQPSLFSVLQSYPPITQVQ